MIDDESDAMRAQAIRSIRSPNPPPAFSGAVNHAFGAEIGKLIVHLRGLNMDRLPGGGAQRHRLKSLSLKEPAKAG